MSEKNLYFELGFLKVKTDDGKVFKLACEEITIGVSNENISRYVCDFVAPVDIASTKKKFHFTIKRPKFFESDILFINSIYGGSIDLMLFRSVLKHDMPDHIRKQARNRQIGEFIKDMLGGPAVILKRATSGPEHTGSVAETEDFIIEHLITLHGCMIDDISFGNFDGTTVNEEVRGVGRHITFSPRVSGYYRNTIQGDEL